MATWFLAATAGNYELLMRLDGWKSLVMPFCYAQPANPAMTPDILAFYGLPPGTQLAQAI